MPLQISPTHIKKILLLCSLFLASTTITYGLGAHFFLQKNAQLSLPSTRQAQAFPEPSQSTIATPSTESKTLSILFLGYGGAGHQGGYLTDAILLAQLNFEAKTLNLISIPRDTWVKFPDGTNRKINAAFTLGGASGETPTTSIEDNQASTGAGYAKSAINHITGIPVDYFVAIDFVGLQKAIHELGGITVNVPETLDDPWYPIAGKEVEPCGKSPEEITELSSSYSGFELEQQFPCRYEHLHYDKGSQEMEGADVLKFVRSRHGSGAGDFSRGIRQQAVVWGSIKKLFTLKALDNIPKFFGKLIVNIQTDINENIITKLSPTLAGVNDFKVKNITLSEVLSQTKSSNGQFILIPKSGTDNWDEVQKYIANKLSE